MNHVPQEHAWGCGVATLAMVTGDTYDGVRRWIVGHWSAKVMGYENAGDWLTHRGVSGPVLDWYLAQHGYAWRRVYSGWEPDPWPPEPFAPVHVAQVVQPSGNTHFVAVTSAGTVLDPASTTPRLLTDWPKVNYVQGIWRIKAGDDS